MRLRACMRVHGGGQGGKRGAARASCTCAASPARAHASAPHVHPSLRWADCVPGDVPRLLINRERVGEGGTYRIMPGMGGGDGFDFDACHRDVLHLGDCDEGARALAAALGWGEQLAALVGEVLDRHPASAARRGGEGGAAGAGARLAAGIGGATGGGSGGQGAAADEGAPEASGSSGRAGSLEPS